MKEKLEKLKQEELILLQRIKEAYDEDCKNGVIDELKEVIECMMETCMVFSEYINAFLYKFGKYRIVKPYVVSRTYILDPPFTLQYYRDVIYSNKNGYEYNSNQCKIFLKECGDIIKNKYYIKKIKETEENIFKYKNSLI